MIKIKPGETLVAARVFSGTNDRGDWMLISVKEGGKGKKVATVWPDNKPQISEGDEFTMESISAVTFGARKKGERWYDDLSVYGKVKPLASYGTRPAPSNAYDGIDDGSDLPF